MCVCVGLCVGVWVWVCGCVGVYVCVGGCVTDNTAEMSVLKITHVLLCTWNVVWITLTVYCNCHQHEYAVEW